MELSAILDLTASCLGLFSGLFFCVGIFHFRIERAEKIAALNWGKGLAIAEEMLLQKSEFIAGTFLLLLSFLVQFVIKAFPFGFSQTITTEHLSGVAVSVAIASAFAIAARVANQALGRVFLKQLHARTEGKL